LLKPSGELNIWKQTAVGEHKVRPYGKKYPFDGELVLEIINLWWQIRER
jgi:hypothetical protein